jgi:hypothetical protein
MVEAIHYNEEVLRHYTLHAFVVMPNQVHLLAIPSVALPKLTKSLVTGGRPTLLSAPADDVILLL